MEDFRQEIIIKITKLEDFKYQVENEIKRLSGKLDEEVIELKFMHKELKTNLDKINGTLVRIQYTLIGGAIMIVINSMGLGEFLSKFLKVML